MHALYRCMHRDITHLMWIVFFTFCHFKLFRHGFSFIAASHSCLFSSRLVETLLPNILLNVAVWSIFKCWIVPANK